MRFLKEYCSLESGAWFAGWPILKSEILSSTCQASSCFIVLNLENTSPCGRMLLADYLYNILEVVWWKVFGDINKCIRETLSSRILKEIMEDEFRPYVVVGTSRGQSCCLSSLNYLWQLFGLISFKSELHYTVGVGKKHGLQNLITSPVHPVDWRVMEGDELKKTIQWL